MSASNEVMAGIRQALQKSNASLNLAKAFTQSANPIAGLTAYSLEAPAKLFVPELTPLRNRLPRATGGAGIQANWRAVVRWNKDNLSAGIGEGNRGGVIGTEVKEYLAAFKSLGLDDYVTFEADLAAQGFDDVKARSVQGLLHSLMRQEELILFGGNATTPLPKPAAPVVLSLIHI
mgnify:FL=1